MNQSWCRSGWKCEYTFQLATIVACVVPGLIGSHVGAQQGARGTAAAAANRFEISYPASANPGPITGRVFVIVSRDSTPEPRMRAGAFSGGSPLFGVDVNALRPGAAAVIDGATPGYPVSDLHAIPPGDYYVQAVLNVYTQFHRADGHTIWAHMDQWEGQHFNRSPGNLVSEVQKVHMDPAAGYDVKLALTRVLPPVDVPQDTRWVKRIRIKSELLSSFWGHPMYLGATILLPKGYHESPGQRYPTIYVQGHFGLRAPFGFDPNGSPETAEARKARLQRTAREPGYEFAQEWMSDSMPRMIAVTFQHPTPYFDDSYAVNSANNGPYGDALMQELIPYLEQHFRMDARPDARFLIGGSTGGWESIALQIYHPDFFGGTWTLYPDPVDFRSYQLSNVYSDTNAFVPNGNDWATPERQMMRNVDGQPMQTMRQMSRLEAVLGSHGRSAQQMNAWDAVYGPVGDDGYPKELWNKMTGTIDHSVAIYMRDHGYDLRYYLEQHWPEIGPKLVGKIHVYVGDMDTFYLNLAVYRLEDFFKQTKNPHYEGTFEYGRPMKPHGWQPMTNVEFVQMMAKTGK